MSLEFLQIHNARNLKEYSLSPHPFFNIIYGSNGVGKTTVLESIFLLLRSRTFRSSKYKSFINHDSKWCPVFSRFSDNCNESDLNNFNLGISRSKESAQPILHLNSKKINSLSTITSLVVLGLITPESFSLLDSGPAIRRKFIDWGVFHVEPDFLSTWRAYKKIINNRNIILKKLSGQYHDYNNVPKDAIENLLCWSPQLVTLNDKLNYFRNNQIYHIEPYFFRFLDKFSPDLASKISLSYYQGWSKELSFSDYLQLKICEDLAAGSTRYGTHRGELRINFNNNPAKDVLSRGQKKIVVICLILAQFSYLINLDKNSHHNILLLDDIDSELDDQNLAILFEILDSLHSQIMVTTTNPQKFTFIANDKCKLFHVEHG